jgi:HK97 family phage major capsid protein
MTAGTALVGAFKTAAQIFRKGGVRVEASNSHADFFVKNLVAIRAEERLALAVYRPAAFGEVTGL